MNAEERRLALLDFIKESKAPVSGAILAKKFQVSRQIIVQDIALLRAADHAIFSTPKGYLCFPPVSVSRVFHVTHTDEQIEEELYTIINLGGKVVDVFIEHEVYGSLHADMNINSAKDISEFLKTIGISNSKPLNSLTSGSHYHTVEAACNEILDEIQDALKEKGFLLQ
jgi:hypothetical protein